jgi:death-on-curing protein
VRARYLDLVDYLLVAEAVLGVDAEDVARFAGIALADSALNAPAAGFGEVEFHPGVERKAAVLLHHLVRNHALPDGNKRVGYLCMLEFLARNGLAWQRSDGDPDETVGMVESVAAGDTELESVVAWITRRTATDAPNPEP